MAMSRAAGVVVEQNNAAGNQPGPELANRFHLRLRAVHVHGEITNLRGSDLCQGRWNLATDDHRARIRSKRLRDFSVTLSILVGIGGGKITARWKAAVGIEQEELFCQLVEVQIFHDG